jgi:hypothetical protein
MAKHRVIWVKRVDAEPLTDAAVRRRAGVEDSAVEVHIESLDKMGIATIPAGSRDEWGSMLPGVMNVGYGELPPAGRLFLAAEPS